MSEEKKPILSSRIVLNMGYLCGLLLLILTLIRIPFLGFLTPIVPILRVVAILLGFSTFIFASILYISARRQPAVYGSTRPIILGFFLGFVCIGFFGFAALKDNHDRKYVRPVEEKNARAAVEAKIQEGKTAVKDNNPVTIDLTPHFNATLTESIHSRKPVKENHLAELPTGLQRFAGIQFDVKGIVQLMGRSLIKFGKKYPAEVSKIKIEKSFNRLHLLHGASSAREGDQAIAKLVLHYKDGTSKTLDIITGKHVSDYWGQATHGLQDGAEIAWLGSNPWIKRWQPGQDLCLYKATFENPEPNKEVAGLDYASTLTDAAPFLIALTVD